MEGQEGLRSDRENYVEAHPHAQHPEPKRKSRPTTRRMRKSAEVSINEPFPNEQAELDVADEQVFEVQEEEQVYEEYEEEQFQPVRHNELEDFLL